MTGQVQGGWEYVIAAYSVTWIVFASYTMSLWLRRPRASAPPPGKEGP